MRVIGLDLSLTSTGVADIHSGAGEGAIALSRLASKGKLGDSLATRRTRLQRIVADVDRVLGERMPDLAVIEGPSFGQARQGGQHDRAGLWWLVVDWLRMRGVPVAEVPPTIVKKYATGSGNAGKDAVLAAVIRRYPDAPVEGNDQADALVLAAMGARHLGHPIEQLPQVHLAAMAKVHWPATESTEGETAL